MTTEPNKLGRLLLTGAAGSLGQVLRQSLKPYALTLRLSDIADLGKAGEQEEVVRCDLADRHAVDRLVHGCEAIVHLGDPADPAAQYQGGGFVKAGPFDTR